MSVRTNVRFRRLSVRALAVAAAASPGVLGPAPAGAATQTINSGDTLNLGNSTNAAIGINFASGRNGANRLQGGDPAGAARQPNWNNVTAGASSTTPQTLGDANNNTSGSLTAFSSTNTYDVFGADQANQNAQIMNAYLDNTGAGTSVSVSGVTYSEYAVLAYMASDGNGRGGHVTLGSTSYYYNTYVNNGGFVGFNPTVSTTTANRPYANFMAFEGQTAASFTLAGVRDGNNSGFAAVQVVPTVTSANDYVVAGDAAINVNGVWQARANSLSIGTNTLSVGGNGFGNDPNNPFESGYALSLGGTTTLTGNPTFNVTNNGGGTGYLNLGAVADGGTGRTITKTGNGTLAFNAAATSAATGTTLNVSGGNVILGLPNALGTAGRVNLATGTVLAVNANQTVASLAGLSAGNGNVVLYGTSLTVGNAENLGTTYGGNISGPASTLIKAGTGTLTLTALSTPTNVQVNGGTLSLSVNQAPTLNSAIAVNSGGTLLLNATNSLIGGAGGTSVVTLNTGGTMTTTNGVTAHIGNVTLAGGTMASGTPAVPWGSYELNAANVITVSANSTISAQNVVLDAGSSVNVSVAGATLSVTGTIFPGQPTAGPTQLTKNGPGTIALSGANSYPGNTTINAGTVRLDSASALAAATGTVLASGGTFTSAVVAANLGGPVTLSGTGTVSPNGTNVGSFTLPTTGAFTMSGGTLAITIGSGGTTYDQIVEATGGTAAFSITGGTLDLSSSGLNINYALSYPILSGFAANSSVAGLTITGYNSAGYTAAFSPTGVLSFTAIPEPATATLGLIAAAGLLARRRRRA